MPDDLRDDGVVRETASVDPLAQGASDYELAIVHIAWARSKASGGLTLLFGYVELLPRETPPPPDLYDVKDKRCSKRLSKKGDTTLYRRHFVMPYAKAVEWYRSCQEGSTKLPWSETSLKTAELGDVPAWPKLVTSDNLDEHPFVTHDLEAPRLHHRYPFAPTDVPWTSEEALSAHAWLRDELHFDLCAFEELVGSVHLVAPNPVFRSYSCRFESRADGAEWVHYQFTTRRGQSVAGLTLHLREVDSGGDTTAGTLVQLTGSDVCVEFASRISAVQLDVWDPARGYLLVSKCPTTCISSAVISGSLAHEVHVPLKRDSFSVARSGPPEKFTVGTVTKLPRSPADFVRSARLARVQPTDTQDSKRFWFKDQRTEARKALRDLLFAAQTRVRIVDGFFGPTEFAELFAIQRTDVTVEVLTSEAHLASLDEAFDAEYKQFMQQYRSNPLEVRVMPGKGGIHDRFFVIDDALWLFGSSLNEFGVRGAVMWLVDKPGKMADDLHAEWGSGVPFEDWIAKRRAIRAKRDE